MRFIRWNWEHDYYCIDFMEIILHLLKKIGIYKPKELDFLMRFRRPVTLKGGFKLIEYN